MVDALVPVVATLLGVTAIYKFAMLRREFIPAQAALAGVFLALTVGVLLFTPAFHVLIGNPALGTSRADVIARTAIVVAATMAQFYLLLLAHEAREAVGLARWRFALAGIVVVAMWTLALLTPAEAFQTRNLDYPTEPVIQGAFLGHLVLALSDVARSAFRWSSSCSGSVRHGLRLITAGSLFGVLYAVTKALSVAAEVSGLPMPREVSTVLGRSLALVGLTLVAAGSLLPALDAALVSVRRQWHAYQAHVALYPLWADLVAVAPGIALEPPAPRWRDRMRVRDLDMRLYRRVIEIRDGELALRTAGPGDGNSRCVAPKALGMWRAMQIVAIGGQRDDPSRTANQASVEDEIAWWTAVAGAYARLGEDPENVTAWSAA